MTKTYVLRYRLTGGEWHDRQLNVAEATMVNVLNQGSIAQMLDVPLTDLVSGDNSLEVPDRERATKLSAGRFSNITLVLTKG